MNKDELIASIARKMNISIEEAAGILDELLSVISKALERGESVDLSGFGRFDVETRADSSTPDTRVPVFRPDRTLMDLVDEVQSDSDLVSKPRKSKSRGLDPNEAPSETAPKSARRSASRSRGAPAVPRMEESAAAAPDFPSDPPDGLTRGRSRGLPPAGVPRMAESAPPATETDKRRVNAHILCAGKKRKTFVRGAENTVRCWIGLAEEGVASSNENIPTTSIPKNGLPLTVQILWRSESDSGQIILPANRTARSGDCDLRLQVPDNARYISAELSFRYRGSVFEMIRLEADVLSADEQEQDHHELILQVEMQHREAIEIEDRHEVDSTIVWGEDRGQIDHPGDAAPSSLRIFGPGDAKHYDLSDAEIAVKRLNEEVFNTTKKLVRKQASNPGDTGEEKLDVDDESVKDIFRLLAQHGATLYNKLADADFKDPGERIQLINTNPKEYCPLEFVYDRGFPDEDVTICADGINALDSESKECPTCTPAHQLTENDRDLPKTICPFGFWSLKKIIERRDPKTMSSDSDGQPSVARTERRSLPAIDRVLFASSFRVSEEERNKTELSLSRSIENSAMAASWTEWKQKLEVEKPDLLVLLPHHHVESFDDYLEIGGEGLVKNDRLLARGRMTDVFVNPDKTDPGPIVILFGCQTAAGSETGYVQLAHKFRSLSTSIVVGTLGKILGRHAGPMAREFVAELASANNPEADFGTIMRQVRRRMLAKGYLMALCLVAFGDAEWRLTPTND